MIDDKMRDAIRTVGFLLETNSTEGTFATTRSGAQIDYRLPEASNFCLSGATLKVARAFLINEYSLYNDVASLVTKDDDSSSLCEIWDSATPRKRKDIIKKLKAV